MYTPLLPDGFARTSVFLKPLGWLVDWVTWFLFNSPKDAGEYSIYGLLQGEMFSNIRLKYAIERAPLQARRANLLGAVKEAKWSHPRMKEC